MAKFEHPPSWWIDLAHLTSWFDWEAIGAIGTVGALWMTIYLATQSERERRSRQAVFLLWVLDPLHWILLTVNDARSNWIEHCETRHIPQNDASRSDWCEFVEARWKEERVEANMNAIERKDFSSVLTHSDFTYCFICWTNIRDHIAERSADWDYLENEVRDFKIKYDSLRSEADRLGGTRRRLRELLSHDLTASLKSLPMRLRTMWTGLPFAKRRQ